RNAGHEIDADYQRLCIRSWLDCGFRVLSINHPDEIGGLAASHPDISFIPTERDASAISGRRMPYIADLLRALIERDGAVAGIINSDLVFEPSAAWRGWLPGAVRDAVVTGQRHDATSLFTGTFRKYYWGFDFFFFDIKTAGDLIETAMPFAMGLAWWDYWLPAAASLKGRHVMTLERPTVAHLIHKEPQLDDSWRQLAMSFANFIMSEAAKYRGVLPPAVSAVLPLCRDLAQMPELRWRNRGADAQIGQIAVQFIPAITRDSTNVPADAGGVAKPTSGDWSSADVFSRFAERLSAGEALERGKQMERQGRVVEARGDYQYAFERTPEDCDLLSAFGGFRLRQGDWIGASELLRKAIENDPNNPSTHCNLAVALHRGNRRTEAREVLEGALSRWPNSTDARELMAKFSREA
ncbi:MAG: tetratricopeptide repeat protein, partial [Gammaproteobacteria bacterium]